MIRGRDEQHAHWQRLRDSLDSQSERTALAQREESRDFWEVWQDRWCLAPSQTPTDGVLGLTHHSQPCATNSWLWSVSSIRIFFPKILKRKCWDSTVCLLTSSDQKMITVKSYSEGETDGPAGEHAAGQERVPKPGYLAPCKTLG